MFPAYFYEELKRLDEEIDGLMNDADYNVLIGGLSMGDLEVITSSLAFREKCMRKRKKLLHGFYKKLVKESEGLMDTWKLAYGKAPAILSDIYIKKCYGGKCVYYRAFNPVDNGEGIYVNRWVRCKEPNSKEHIIEFKNSGPNRDNFSKELMMVFTFYLKVTDNYAWSMDRTVDFFSKEKARIHFKDKAMFSDLLITGRIRF